MARQKHPHHRQLLVLAGSPAYCRELLTVITACYAEHDIISLGQADAGLSHSLPIKAYRQILGRECHLGVYDAFDAFRPNAILALSGTVVNNGLMVLCCPALCLWPTYRESTDNHYLSYAEHFNRSALRMHVSEAFTADSDIALCEQNGTLRLPSGKTTTPDQFAHWPFKSQEQERVFNHLYADLLTQCALITADRGRGKSTLLGMLAGKALVQHSTSVLITSRYSESIAHVFKGLALTCPDVIFVSKHHVTYQHLSCQWVPLDHPMLSQAEEYLLIIDEAASIPLPQLTTLCCTATSLLMSTTMRGYEGSGRGFITRFLPWLHRRRPATKHYQLTEPVRWYPDDPLEQFWYQQFCITDNQDMFNTGQNALSRQTIETLSVEQLSTGDIFSITGKQVLPLLMQAHYQTTADELVRLADSPANMTLIARSGDQVVGVLNYQCEGGIALTGVASAIASGQRRVNGHLSAQAISLLLASPDAAVQSYWRINRIAVLPAFRRCGIASTMLEHLLKLAQTAEADALTTSFGVTSDLVSFWQHNGFMHAKPGLKKDASSGEYSLLMIKPITDDAVALSLQIQHRYLQERNTHPAPEVFGIPVINTGTHSETDAIPACNLRILHQVKDGQRSLQHARGALLWWLNNALDSWANNEDITVLKDYLTHINNTPAFTAKYQLSGKKAAEKRIQEVINKLVK